MLHVAKWDQLVAKSTGDEEEPLTRLKTYSYYLIMQSQYMLQTRSLQLQEMYLRKK